MREHRSISIVVSALMLISILLSSPTIIPSSSGAGPTRDLYISHSPIEIDGDLELDAMAITESWPGTGGDGDPYIISGYHIIATGHSFGIRISDTRLQVTIRENLIEDVDSGVGAGLNIHNSDNVRIENNIIRDCGSMNIYLTGSNITEITNNRLEGNVTTHSIQIHNCLDTVVASNEIFWSTANGINVDGAHNLTIYNNRIEECADTGIALSSTTDSLVDANVVSNCGVRGMGSYLTSDRISFFENTLIGNDMDVLNIGTCEISLNNTVDGIPVRQYVDEDLAGVSIPHSTSQFFLHNVSGFKLDGFEYSKPYDPIKARYSNNITITNGTFQENRLPLYLYHCDDVTVTDSYFRDVMGSSVSASFGMRYLFSNNVFINVSSAIETYLTEDMTILNSSMDVYRWGLLITNTKGIEIKDNVITGSERAIDGISLSGPEDMEIVNNHITGFGRCGFSTMNPRNGIVRDNEIIGPANATGSAGMKISGPSNILIKNNTIKGHSYGLNLSSLSEDSIITMNRIEENLEDGIRLIDATGHTIDGNLIFNNGKYGISSSGSIDCIIVNNTLIMNHGSGDSFDSLTVQGWDDSDDNHWNGPGYGNYWRDWTSPDPDGDGIVNSPYIVIGGNSFDHYPVTAPIYTYLSAPTEPIIDIGREKVDLIWCSPEMDLSGNIEGYVIDRSEEDGQTERMLMSNMTFFYSDEDVADGVTYTYMIRAINMYGEGRPTTELSGTPDSSSPAINITSPADGVILPNGTFDLEWTFTDNVGVILVEISMDTITWYDMGMNLSYPVTNLTDGEHQFFIRATDVLGNNATENITVVVDMTAPVIRNITPVNGTSTNSKILNIEWVVEDSITAIASTWIKLDEGGWIDVFLNNSANITFTSQGTHTISIRTKDLAGNTEERSIEIMVDWTPPDVFITFPVEEYTAFIPVLNAQWMIYDTYSFIVGLKIWIDEESPIELPVPTFSYLFSSISIGEHVLHVSATDEAGNERIVTANFTSIPFIVDPTHILIKGRVLDEYNIPIHGVDVSSDTGNETITDSDGYFSLEVPRGQRMLTFKKKGFETRDVQADASSNQTYQLGDLILIDAEETEDKGLFRRLTENTFCQICCISMIAIPVLLMLLGISARARSKGKRARKIKRRRYEE